MCIFFQFSNGTLCTREGMQEANWSTPAGKYAWWSGVTNLSLHFDFVPQFLLLVQRFASGSLPANFVTEHKTQRTQPRQHTVNYSNASECLFLHFIVGRFVEFYWLWFPFQQLKNRSRGRGRIRDLLQHLLHHLLCWPHPHVDHTQEVGYVYIHTHQTEKEKHNSWMRESKKVPSCPIPSFSLEELMVHCVCICETDSAITCTISPFSSLSPLLSVSLSPLSLSLPSLPLLHTPVWYSYIQVYKVWVYTISGWKLWRRIFPGKMADDNRDHTASVPASEMMQ